MSIINFEIEEVLKICENVVPNSKIITCTRILVRVDIKQSQTSRQITACLRFPETYPEQGLLIELKSKSLCVKFLDGLANIAEQKLKELLGKPQVIFVLKFIAQYLAENPLCVIYDEILSVKKLLGDSGDLKLKQKTSSLTLTVRSDNGFYFRIKPEIPEEYPEKSLKWKDHECNLPVVLIRYLNGQAREIARQCVEMPLRAVKNGKADPFKPSPSVLKTLKFIIEAMKDFCNEICPICEQKVLPDKPEQVIEDDSNDFYVERVYCGHLFHQVCLKKYMQNPPFPPGGKLCPANKRHPRSDDTHRNIQPRDTKSSTEKQRINGKRETTCGIRLAHDRWVVNVQMAEARWAQKQARERELEEVVDFLQ